MPFTLGSYTFGANQTPAPGPIADAPPPTHLRGCVTASTSDSGTVLRSGAFCGHGEATFTVFDISVHGTIDLEVAAWIGDSQTEDPQCVLARIPANGDRWLVIFDQAWQGDDGILRLPETPVWIDVQKDDERVAEENICRARLSVGFEYPSDARNINDVSWLAIDAWPEGNDESPVVLVSAETG